MIAQAKLTIKTRRAHLLLSKFRPHGPWFDRGAQQNPYATIRVS